MGTKEELAYLEEERKKLWADVTNLKEQMKRVQKATPEQVKAILEKSEEVDTTHAKVKEIYESVTRKNQTISGFLSDITEYSEKSSVLFSTIEASYKKVEELLQGAAKASTESNELLGNSKQIRIDLDAIINELKTKTFTLQEIETLLTSSSEIKDKIDLTYANINKYFTEISSLHKKIYGFIEESEEDKEVKVLGLKDELEKSYKKLTEELNELHEEIVSALKRSREDSVAIRGQWESEHSALKAKIESLLPGALTTGLSYAYKNKKDDEIIAMGDSNASFRRAIQGLIAISLIPFFISLYLLIDGIGLIDVIYKLPRMVLAILPLYIPVLWIAYSSSKKVNLSKRLIEEYAHKEALSKTFEGLSSQINNIKDDHDKEELRAKLLYNLLEVSAENPGKLIYDYNNADHPLMDALDKSVKLSDAITKIAKIPGMTKLTTALIEKEKRLSAEMDQKASDGIETSEDLTNRSEKTEKE